MPSDPPVQPAPPGPAVPPTPSLPSCHSCGQALTPEGTKCPACGAPVKGAAKRTNPNLLSFAGFILAALVIVAGLATYDSFRVDDKTIQTVNPLGTQEIALTGLATLEDGRTGNVTIAVDSGNGTTSEATGGYTARFTTGYHRVTFSAPNHTSIVLHVYLYSDATADIALQPGSGSVEQFHTSYRTLEMALKVRGTAFLLSCILLVAGAIACIRRTSYRTAFWAAIAGFLPGLFTLVYIPLPIIALVLIIRGKRNFRSKAPKPVGAPA